MKEAFIDDNFSAEKLNRIRQANDIIEAYQAQGLTLTLRQLYYQHVTRNLITNEEKSYKNLGKLISDARQAGLIDWDAIEDRVRVPVKPQPVGQLGRHFGICLRQFPAASLGRPRVLRGTLGGKRRSFGRLTAPGP